METLYAIVFVLRFPDNSIGRLARGELLDFLPRRFDTSAYGHGIHTGYVLIRLNKAIDDMACRAVTRDRLSEALSNPRPAELLNAYFQEIFVISLERSRRRREEVSNELKGQNILFNFYPATDGRQLNLDELAARNIYSKELNVERRPYPMTTAEIGCAYSVLKVCHLARQRKLERFLILQDDIRVVRQNLRYLKASLDNAPSSWELLYLGHIIMNMRIPPFVRLKLRTIYPLQCLIGIRDTASMIKIYRSFRRPFNKYWGCAGRFNGAYAYALSSMGRDRLIDALTPIWAPDDAVFQHLIREGAIDAYSPRYQFFEHRNDIESEISVRPAWHNQ